LKKFVFLWLAFSAYINALPAQIDDFIHSSGIPKKDISLYIQDIQSQEIIASLNRSISRTPASVVKIFTTYSILRKLWFAYKIPTDFYIRGDIQNGILNGDLIVKAYGDPTLNNKDLDAIVSAIKTKGITEITGNIIIDRSYFKVSGKNNSGFDNNRYSPYNAMPDAMMFNQRISTLCINAKQHKVYTKIPDESIVIHNKFKLVNRYCRGKYAWPSIAIDDSKETTQIWLSGKVSKRCPQKNICQVLTKPYKSFFYALKSKLNQNGIRTNASLKLSRVPKGAKFLYKHRSASLEKIVSITAKKSNNLFARHLMLILGAKIYGAPSTLQKGRDAIKRVLKENHINISPSLYIDNGCGLSREAKLDVISINNLLQKAYAQYGYKWLKTLSIAGVDGTIKRRFKRSIVKNHAWMKTGTLKRVKNIAGYVKSKSGRLYSVIILVNTKKGNFRAAKLQNDIIRWLVNYKTNSSTDIIDSILKEETTQEQGISKTKKSYYIQIGSFNSTPPQRYLSHITRLGYRYKLVGSSPIKVHIGSFISESDAKSELKTIQDEINSNAFIVKE
jgi:D-alanyl-D-alanine carboxypeptidase/D-alanyl-D-alanine-endopeptidase (penicillin-binding protein 4)